MSGSKECSISKRLNNQEKSILMDLLGNSSKALASALCQFITEDTAVNQIWIKDGIICFVEDIDRGVFFFRVYDITKKVPMQLFERSYESAQFFWAKENVLTFKGGKCSYGIAFKYLDESAQFKKSLTYYERELRRPPTRNRDRIQKQRDQSKPRPKTVFGNFFAARDKSPERESIPHFHRNPQRRESATFYSNISKSVSNETLNSNSQNESDPANLTPPKPKPAPRYFSDVSAPEEPKLVQDEQNIVFRNSGQEQESVTVFRQESSQSSLRYSKIQRPQPRIARMKKIFNDND